MENNKYYHDPEGFSEDPERALRRKRHRRTRMIAWVSFISVLVLLCVGGFFLIKGLSAKLSKVDLKRIIGGDSPVSASASASDSGSDQIVENINDHEKDIVVDPKDEPKSPTEEELFEQAVDKFVASMSLKDKVAGLFIVSPEQITGVDAAVMAGDGTRVALEKYAVGGIIYSDKNITASDKFATMLQKTREFARYPLFLAIDEELGNGVLVSKLKLEGTLNASDLGLTGNSDTAMSEAGRLADYLKNHGINLNFGIVADVLTNPENALLAGRSFSADADVCAQMTEACVKAFNERGITVALKSFPGEGDVTVDTKDTIATTERSLEEMKECEFKSFIAGIDAGADMLRISHICAPNVTGDSELCSSSKALLTDILRSEYGYDNLIIITDALNKGAVSNYYDSAEAAVTSLKAGADMLLLPENFDEAYNGVIDAVYKGVVSIERINASLKRIYRVKFRGMTSDEILTLVGMQDASGNN
ncbi:MAG: beta-N-acetylhexosaminidase [Lachnospiraceae bacterium]|nr:beta-N-acetylhexosaminidase [Lachnospiraceae bacterium]